MFYLPNGAIAFDMDNNEVIAPLYSHVRIRSGMMASAKNILRSQKVMDFSTIRDYLVCYLMVKECNEDNETVCGSSHMLARVNSTRLYAVVSDFG